MSSEITLLNRREDYPLVVTVADDVDLSRDFEASADGMTFVVVREAWDIERAAPARAAAVVAGVLALATCAAVTVGLLPPCAYEDSTFCHWNAAERGNGLGRSFTNLAGVVIYWQGSR